jgi:hypothetical protein
VARRFHRHREGNPGLMPLQLEPAECRADLLRS